MSNSPLTLPPEPNAVAWSARLRALAARFGDRVALCDGQSTLTYGELARRAHAAHAAKP